MARKHNAQHLAANGLEEPFAASPQRPPRYGIYVGSTNAERPHTYQSFYAMYAAHRFLTTVIGDRRTTWHNDHLLGIEGTDIIIRPDHASDLQDILEYEPTDAEKGWITPEPYRTNWLRLGHLEPAPQPKTSAYTEPQEPAAPKTPRSPKAPRPSRDGMTSLADITASLGMEARDARAILRKSNFPKPDAGWAWPAGHADIERVTDILKKGAKK